MMFGLPAACLAMYHAARPERRRAIAGLLVSIALTSLLTGVTEPIEFTFMFLAPALYALHALLTGVSFVIMNWLHVRLGFGFSAGLFDYVLNFNKATNPWLLLPVGAFYFLVYYTVFRLVIVRLDLKTPGREAAGAGADSGGAGTAARAELSDGDDRATGFLLALGGATNIRSLSACTTRLRLTLADPSVVNEAALGRLGARGVVRPSADSLQVVVGPDADQIAGELHRVLRAGPQPAANGLAVRSIDQLTRVLGGRTNIRALEVTDSRLRIRVGNPEAVDIPALHGLGFRGVAITATDWIHLIVGPSATEAAAALRQRIESQ